MEMRRRTDAVLSAETLLQQVRHAPVPPPWTRVRLERDSFLDYRQRPVSANVSVAELYHENSKLFPATATELTATRTDAAEFRLHVVRDRAAHQRAPASDPRVGAAWCAALRAVGDAVGLDVFYAVELRVASGDLLALHEPVPGTWHPVKRLEAADWAVLRRAGQLMAAPGRPPHDGPLLIMLGRFAWNDLLLGSRGYRRTLMEAGQLAQEVIHQAVQANLTVMPLYEFTDRDVDAVMEADGVEEGTLMMFELGGAGDDG